MRFTDFTLKRLVWFSAIGRRDYLAHIVARDLIRRAMANEKQNFEKLLWIIRRYE